MTPQQWRPVNGARYDEETVTRPGRRTTTSVVAPERRTQAPELAVSQRDQRTPTGTTLAAGTSITMRSARTDTAVASGPTIGRAGPTRHTVHSGSECTTLSHGGGVRSRRNSERADQSWVWRPSAT